ncbi:MAG: ABC transporter permease [Oscillospiraceae bacterium]|jgi:putative ABC transport system permease protein|nr:ABC transporter permease [Oscillospiraceae bacterium]
MSKPLSLNKIAVRNITRRYTRSLFLVSLVALLAFVLTAGSLLVSSLRNGTRSMAARLGADLLLVPAGYESDTEGALLRGEPSSFYFTPELAERLAQTDGILQSSPQLFIASMNSEHCSEIVQFIGFEPRTDFVIKPWLAERLPNGIPSGQIVIGSSINGKAGDELTFFGRKYIVAARLERTGMGFDTSVFADMDTTRIALNDYVSVGGENPPENKPGIASVIMVNLQPGTDINAFARSVRDDYRREGVGVLFPQAMISSISGSLGDLVRITTVLLVLLWLLAVGVLTLLFSVTVNERKREFGIYRALGSTKSWLARLILTESTAISGSGALVGTALAAFVYTLFGTAIGISIDAPYLFPSAAETALTIAGGFALAFIAGPIAAAYGAKKIGNLATYAIMREGD